MVQLIRVGNFIRLKIKIGKGKKMDQMTIYGAFRKKRIYMFLVNQISKIKLLKMYMLLKALIPLLGDNRPLV